MKKLSIIASCLLLMADLTFGQTQSMRLVTSGTGSAGATSRTFSAGVSNPFSLDVYMTFTGFTAVGLSYWMEGTTALANNLTLNSQTYTIWDPTQNGTNNGFANNVGCDSGFLRETRDLGATSNFDSDNNVFTDPKAPGTHQVATLNLTIGAALAPGVYTLALTHLGPATSEISDSNFTPHNVPQAFYTITIVPEPATWSLLGLGGLGAFGLSWLRACRK